MTDKIRLDTYLTTNGLAQSREKGKTMILAGNVFVNNQQCTKPNTPVSDDDCVEIKGEVLKYVSRGGLKLEKAINVFSICLQNKICMDIGASTGGFTDCMLQNGAKHVYAVDVGSAQLAEKLCCDVRVTNMEKTNIRYLNSEKIGETVGFVSIDVSFISLSYVLPIVYNLLVDEGEAVALVKPQFEAGKEHVGKKGVVKNKKIHLQVLRRIFSLCEELGFGVYGVDFSPVTGPEGNIEYLIYIKKKGNSTVFLPTLDDVVTRSHALLKK